jgi:hypothetical protein
MLEPRLYALPLWPNGQIVFLLCYEGPSLAREQRLHLRGEGSGGGWGRNVKSRPGRAAFNLKYNLGVKSEIS